MKDIFLSEKSKFSHSLYSYVFSYSTLSGGKDVLKIEINYSDRVHIFKPVFSESINKITDKINVLRLSDDELIGTKINALIIRTTPRDIYDVYTIFQNNLIKDEKLVRKIAIFYACLGSKIPVQFDLMLNLALKRISELNFKKIKETLIPVLHKKSAIEIEKMSDYVSKKLKSLFILDDNDRTFINEYNIKNFNPKILFEGYLTNDLSIHPMGIWKTNC